MTDTQALGFACLLLSIVFALLAIKDAIKKLGRRDDD